MVYTPLYENSIPVSAAVETDNSVLKKLIQKKNI